MIGVLSTSGWRAPLRLADRQPESNGLWVQGAPGQDSDDSGTGFDGSAKLPAFFEYTVSRESLVL